MSSQQELTLKLPLRVITEILQYIPKKELKKLQKRLQEREVKSVPANKLVDLIGIISIGGNALQDTERVWE